RVKRELVSDAIADAEQIEVTNREMENWLQLLTIVGGGTRRRPNDLTPGQRAAVLGRLRRDKAAARLVEIATAEQTGRYAAAASETNREASASETNAKDAATAVDAEGTNVGEAEVGRPATTAN